MTATTHNPGDISRAKARFYGQALTLLKDRYPNEWQIWYDIAKLSKQGTPDYEAKKMLRERYRKEFNQLRKALFDDWMGLGVPPTDEEQEAALASIREAMQELAAKDAAECAEPEPDEAPGSEEPEPEQLVVIHAPEPTVKPMSVHAALLLYLEERGCEMPPVEAITGLAELQGDPDARSFVREQVMVVAVIAHHLGTTVEECLDLGVAC